MALGEEDLAGGLRGSPWSAEISRPALCPDLCLSQGAKPCSHAISPPTPVSALVPTTSSHPFTPGDAPIPILSSRKAVFLSDHPFQSDQFSLNYFHSDVPPSTQTEFVIQGDFQYCPQPPVPPLPPPCYQQRVPVVHRGFPRYHPPIPTCPGEGGLKLPREGPQPIKSQGLNRLTWATFLLMHMD